MLHSFTDIHTHIVGRPNSVLSIPADEVEKIIASNQQLPDDQKQHFSFQLHPWFLAKDEPTFLAQLAEFHAKALQYRNDPCLVAIGECGLDSMCDVPMEVQKKAFVFALQMAKDQRLPVIIHCVKMWAEIMDEVKRIFGETAEGKAYNPSIVIHGFRKGPVLAQQLLKAGFCISLGIQYNPETLAVIPEDRLFHETDENTL